MSTEISYKPSELQFNEYVEIRDSGKVNMFDVKRVEKLSKTGLNTLHCFYIMHKNHFLELAEEYEVEV